MKIAIIMIHYGTRSTTASSLRELQKKIGQNILILINNTLSDSKDLAAIIPGTIMIENHKNVGFAVAVNQGLSRAMKDKNIGAFLLMNNDLSFSFGSLDRLGLTFLDKKTSGIVSPVLHHGGSLYDWGGKYNPWTALVRHRNFEQRPKTTLVVDHVAGAAMLIKREVVDKIGYFDERFFLYYEDLDYCLRAKAAGYTIHINPEMVADHQVSAGSSPFGRSLHQWKSHLQFVLKHLPRVAYPTALLTDLLYYPLILIKIAVLRK